MRKFALGLGVVVLAIAGGCSRDRGDADVSRATQQEMQAEPGLTAVVVEVFPDRIRLTGNVPDEQHRARAEVICRKHAAGKSVVNDLKVAPAGAKEKEWGDKAKEAIDRAGEKTREAGDKAKEAIDRAGEKTHEALDSAAENTRKAISGAIDFVENLDVRVNGKKVTLHGIVPDEAAKDRAGKIAHEKGAEDVDNEIQVKGK